MRWNNSKFRNCLLIWLKQSVHRRCFIFILFVLFENIGERSERARTSAEREKEKFFFLQHYPLALAVNKSPALDGLWRENRGSVNRPVEGGLFNYMYSPDRISPIKTSLYGVYYVSSFLPYPGREFLCWFKIISLRSDWYMKENFNRSDRFGEFKLLLTTGDGQPSFVTLVQKRGQFSLRSVGLPCDTLILVFLWLA